MRGALTAICVALVLIVVGVSCSGDDKATTADEAAQVGLTTAPPSTGPIVTTTTVAGTPVSDAEIYAQAGLDSTQAACVEASGVDGEFTTEPGPTVLDAMVLTADDGTMVAVPAEVRTGTELQQLMLDTLATSCAPHDVLARLAAIDGAAIDEAALADDLPPRVYHRQREGATPAEAECLDAKFREAPVRLSSLVANPRLVESQCVSDERLTAWRAAALDAGLATAAATDPERSCLVTNVGDQVLLATAVDAVSAGEAPPDLSGSTPPTCVSAERLQALAVEIVAKGAEFGAETLAPG